MILEGNARGGAKDLSRHLLKDENDHVTVHEIRGFMAQELTPALNEAYAISRGTKAKKFLYSLSLNPPETEKVQTPVFMDAIARTEKTLGFEGQPRAIVFHEKNGRRHCHVVWSRIDAERMRAIPVSNDHYKLQDLSRELYLENNWTMPKGFIRSKNKDPNSFTLAEWQQSKRTGKHPKATKKTIKDCWAASQDQEALRQNLKEHGYILAIGRRGFIAVDHHCEIYSLASQLGIRKKEVEAKLGKSNLSSSPTIEETKLQISAMMSQNIKVMRKKQADAIVERQNEISDSLKQLKLKQKALRQTLKERQQSRFNAEYAARQRRFATGFKGLWERLTGKRNQIIQQNEADAKQARQRDQAEFDQLVFSQLVQRRSLTKRMNRLRQFDGQQEQKLKSDIRQYDDIAQRKRDRFTLNFNDETKTNHIKPKQQDLELS